MRRCSIALLLFTLLSGLSSLAAGEKVVCAAFSEKEPVIDGKLDDECWKNTMFVSDFTYRATDNPLASDETIFMGVVFTNRYLCLALKADIKYREHAAKFFNETMALKKAGKKKRYMSKFSAELLFTPKNILTSKQTWQLLADSFNDYLIRHSQYWGDYPGKIVSAGTFDGRYWYYELMVEYPGLKPGDIIPCNLMINEDTVPFANWQNYETAYYVPSNMCGRIIFGTPEQMKKSGFLEQLKKNYAMIRQDTKNDPEMEAFYPVLDEALADFETFLYSGPKIENHKQLKDFMRCFNSLSNVYQRMKNLYRFRNADKNKQGEKKGFFSSLFQN